MSHPPLTVRRPIFMLAILGALALAGAVGTAHASAVTTPKQLIPLDQLIDVRW
jgi:hypothetical protein